MPDYPLFGGCLCGAVRYRIDAAPSVCCVCHCASCRRSAGADSVGWLTAAAGDFALVRGELSIHESSPGVGRGFCARCGSSLTYRNAADSVDVALASLDDPEALRPTEEVWLEERLSWNPANPDLRPHRRGTGG
ncbi:MAG: GFA family protein [Amaricoccus sp.]